MSAENVELIQRTIAAFNEGEDVLDTLWSSDAEVWPAPGFPEGGPFKGRAEVRRFFDGLRAGWKPGSHAIPREIQQAGDKVLVSFEWRAVGEASGLETSSDWLAVYTVRDGLIARLAFFVDRAAAIDAAGTSQAGR